VRYQSYRSPARIRVREAGTDFDAGIVSHVISTGDVARDGAIIEPDGWELDNFRANPVVLLNHGAGNDGLPIATATEVRVEDGALLATAQFDLEDPVAVKVLRKIQAGGLNATSVVWKPLDPPRMERRTLRHDDGSEAEREVIVFPRNDLLEYSVVAVPADPGALLMRAADGAAVDPASLLERNDDADDIDMGSDLTITELTQQLHELVLTRSVLTDAEQVAIGGLYRLVDTAGSTHEAELAEIVASLARDIRGLAAQQAAAPSGDAALVRALARFTGRSESDIRQTIEG
jgi:phage head maturation protease